MLECAATIEAQLLAQGVTVKVDAWENRGPCVRVTLMDDEVLCLVGRVYSTRARALIQTAFSWAVEFPRAKRRSENRAQPAFWGGSNGGVYW